MFARYPSAYRALLTLAAIEFVIAFSIGTAPITTYLSIQGFLRTSLSALVLIPLAWTGFLAVEIARRQIDRPFAAIWRLLIRQRHWLGRGVLFMAVTLTLGRAFTSFKSAIPDIVPYWSDQWLAELDQIIFGVDPWRLTHAAIGPIGTMVLDRVYAMWFIIMTLYIGWFCFTKNQKLQLRGLLAYLLTWGVLGNATALAFSSVGPCFYDHFYRDARFVPLIQQLRVINTEHRIYALDAMKYLVDSIGTDRFGTGISAMPSLHVAISLLCFLVAWEYGRHWWARALGFLFFALITVGSVHLGWHYAADGIVSIVGTLLIWWLSGQFVKRMTLA